MDALDDLLHKRDVVILDGGLATHLETLGADISHPLWSFKMLIEQPELVKQAHLDYMLAGSDIVITSSYQATLPVLAKHGFDRTQAIALLKKSVQVAIDAREDFMQQQPTQGRPLVAASVGPYGASTCDGAEYHGHYGLTCAELAEFHRDRMEVLVGCSPDILAVETVPSFLEVQAITALLQEVAPGVPAWVAVSCRDGCTMNDGTPIQSFHSHMNGVQRQALTLPGINCTHPEFVTPLLSAMSAGRRAGGGACQPFVVYPNSGEGWDAVAKAWVPNELGLSSFEQTALQWRALGARVIGGCCRTGPTHIRLLRSQLMGPKLEE
mmetsp:Transcript_49798/g.125208  ORF Transcript_49798/g.125208 Transcript_49798/m.125208 type:complete len:324 (+) Transcript_49798:204-1175(+)|eukprot:CAMPEP_0177634280 /NCGR_PEP_ID=MMETSP0447-20121125/3284_1 /TAXON_ID=0 /ORGANISM="Stygamoeba regulata, Strain BSH-02190019" /LENGTH=323 /DNA_ID=CAMNT_0019135991 /DNA_START=175 /DNA_END=1146 /DNA_ORIENTATION=+